MVFDGPVALLQIELRTKALEKKISDMKGEVIAIEIFCERSTMFYAALVVKVSFFPGFSLVIRELF